MPASPENGDPLLGPARAPSVFGVHNSTSVQIPRAEPPRAPALPQALQRAQAEHKASLRERETLERRSILRGLILFAVLVLLISLLRAGWSRAFPAGWQW